MASAAQVRANRLNARKSTGPRTAEGKAVVAQNAVKHGLLAQQVVVRGEDPGEFELYRDGMLKDLGPVGSLEGLLAERVAHLGWRLRRAERIERAAYVTLETDYAAREASTPPALRRPQGEAQDDEETVLARVVVDDFGRAKLLDRLLGYERRIENSLYRTMSELRKQQILREVERSEYRLQAGEESSGPAEPAPFRVNAVLQTAPETPYGVTTNGSESDDEVRQTNPIDAGSPDDQASATAVEEVGRGRPTYEEPPEGGTPNGPSGETKPIGDGEDPSGAVPFPQA